MSHPSSGDPRHDLDWGDVRRLLRKRLLALSRSEDRDDLEDLVQESCVRVFRALGAGEARNLDGLASVVARRTWVDYLRRKTRARRHLVVTDSAVLDASSSAAHADTGDDGHLGGLRHRIELIVQEVFDEHGAGACLELARAYFDERDWSVVARQLELSHASIRKRWSRCLRTLREAMARDPDLAPLFVDAGDSHPAAPGA